MRVQRLCARFGTPLQRSVYQCDINDAALLDLQRLMLLRIDSAEDTVAYYPICAKDKLQTAPVGVSHKGAVTNHDHWVI